MKRGSPPAAVRPLTSVSGWQATSTSMVKGEVSFLKAAAKARAASGKRPAVRSSRAEPAMSEAGGMGEAPAAGAGGGAVRTGGEDVAAMGAAVSSRAGPGVGTGIPGAGAGRVFSWGACAGAAGVSSASDSTALGGTGARETYSEGLRKKNQTAAKERTATAEAAAP